MLVIQQPALLAAILQVQNLISVLAKNDINLCSETLLIMLKLQLETLSYVNFQSVKIKMNITYTTNHW